MAAIKMYKFPKELPLTLYLCPENDRERWLAELDIDPLKMNTTTKLAVCSLHFRDGHPSDQFPLPTELLSDKLPVVDKPHFLGLRGASEESMEEMSESDGEELSSWTRLVSKMPKKSLAERAKLATKARRKRRQWVPAVDYSDKKSMHVRRKKLSHDSLFGSRIQCRFCSMKILGAKQYFRHVRKIHLHSISKKNSVVDVQSIIAQETPVSTKKEKVRRRVVKHTFLNNMNDPILFAENQGAACGVDS